VFYFLFSRFADGQSPCTEGTELPRQDTDVSNKDPESSAKMSDPAYPQEPDHKVERESGTSGK
jgi:hypothetical protein